MCEHSYLRGKQTHLILYSPQITHHDLEKWWQRVFQICTVSIKIKLKIQSYEDNREKKKITVSSGFIWVAQI